MAKYDHTGGQPGDMARDQQGSFADAVSQSYSNKHDDFEYGYDEAEDTQLHDIGERRFAKAANMLGAVASLALVVGIGVWGYKLMVRDVSGVPVVRALEGPMRLQPKDPGGRPADHQGLAVNAVAASGSAEPTADRVKLAPKPVSLSEEDQPMGEYASEPEMPEEKPVMRLHPEPAQAKTSEPTKASVVAFQKGQVDALVAELTASVPKSDLQSQQPKTQQVAAARIVQPEALKPVVAATAAKPDVEVPAIVTGPGVARSLRPQVRPARALPNGQDAEAVQSVNAAVLASVALDVDPAALPAGTKLAQLGAYESVEVAQAEWERIHGRFSDYLEGKQRVIQKASSGGRTFYRLRAMGFDDLSDARRFCSALVAQSADCIPVTTR
jgi:sporulation related protein